MFLQTRPPGGPLFISNPASRTLNSRRIRVLIFCQFTIRFDQDLRLKNPVTRGSSPSSSPEHRSCTEGWVQMLARSNGVAKVARRFARSPLILISSMWHHPDMLLPLLLALSSPGILIDICFGLPGWLRLDFSTSPVSSYLPVFEIDDGCIPARSRPMKPRADRAETRLASFSSSSRLVCAAASLEAAHRSSTILCVRRRHTK